MREASFFLLLLFPSGWNVMFMDWFWPKVNNCLLRCCAVLSLASNSTRQKIFILLLLLACVNIVAATHTHTCTLDESHCDCVFVVFLFDFHGFLDWSRSTKTGAQLTLSALTVCYGSERRKKNNKFTLFTVWLCCNHSMSAFKQIELLMLLIAGCVCVSACFFCALKIIRRLSLGCSLPKC